MGNKNLLKCCGISLLCVIVFFVTYYGGLFFSLKIYAGFVGFITPLLLIARSFNLWGIKVSMYTIAVLVVTGIGQQFNLHEFVGDKLLGIDMGCRMWGQSLVYSNAIWFLIMFSSGLFSLAVTAIIVYNESK